MFEDIESMQWQAGRLYGNGLDLSINEAFEIVNRLNDRHKTVSDEIWSKIAEACKWVLRGNNLSFKYEITIIIKSLDIEDNIRNKIRKFENG